MCYIIATLGKGEGHSENIQVGGVIRFSMRTQPEKGEGGGHRQIQLFEKGGSQKQGRSP